MADKIEENNIDAASQKALDDKKAYDGQTSGNEQQRAGLYFAQNEQEELKIKREKDNKVIKAALISELDQIYADLEALNIKIAEQEEKVENIRADLAAVQEQNILLANEIVDIDIRISSLNDQSLELSQKFTQSMSDVQEALQTTEQYETLLEKTNLVLLEREHENESEIGVIMVVQRDENGNLFVQENINGPEGMVLVNRALNEQELGEVAKQLESGKILAADATGLQREIANDYTNIVIPNDAEKLNIFTDMADKQMAIQLQQEKLLEMRDALEKQLNSGKEEELRLKQQLAQEVKVLEDLYSEKKQLIARAEAIVDQDSELSEQLKLYEQRLSSLDHDILLNEAQQDTLQKDANYHEAIAQNYSVKITSLKNELSDISSDMDLNKDMLSNYQNDLTIALAGLDIAQVEYDNRIADIKANQAILDQFESDYLDEQGMEITFLMISEEEYIEGEENDEEIGYADLITEKDGYYFLADAPEPKPDDYDTVKEQIAAYNKIYDEYKALEKELGLDDKDSFDAHLEAFFDISSAEFEVDHAKYWIAETQGQIATYTERITTIQSEISTLTALQETEQGLAEADLEKLEQLREQHNLLIVEKNELVQQITDLKDQISKFESGIAQNGDADRDISDLSFDLDQRKYQMGVDFRERGKVLTQEDIEHYARTTPGIDEEIIYEFLAKNPDIAFQGSTRELGSAADKFDPDGGIQPSTQLAMTSNFNINSGAAPTPSQPTPGNEGPSKDQELVKKVNFTPGSDRFA